MRRMWLAATLVICCVALRELTDAPVVHAEETAAAAAVKPLVLKTRSRVGQSLEEPLTKAVVKEATVEWDPRKTALIICDMWDQHWCKGAAARVEELAGPMNKVIHAARDRGVFIIHAPSTTVDFYKGTPQRRLAQTAPFVKTRLPLATVERWGTAWCYPDGKREAELPIDDTDMGCDCETKCEIVPPWTRQINTIDILEGDAITDHGQETFNLLADRGIDHVIIMGVHLNMCVLGRPFAIRQLVTQGKDVLLVRDMTDTMYCSKSKPFVSHFAGTDLVISHVEKHWCPTILSSDLVGGKPFRFREDKRQDVAGK
ncbi:protein-signal peptide and transmembrane prediction [Schlesneria sp.]|uniref:protein-signal peptide and transmembrane prediction n=1 Tax=Schlesneria sp. TaxID=2762018 RepID=UPI002F1960D8